MDFAFIGGASGSVVGEKFVRAGNIALRKQIPFHHDFRFRRRTHAGRGALLMQLRGHARKLAEAAEARIPYISIMTDPTDRRLFGKFCHASGRSTSPSRTRSSVLPVPASSSRPSTKTTPRISTRRFPYRARNLDLIVDRKEMKKTIANLWDICFINSRVFPAMPRALWYYNKFTIFEIVFQLRVVTFFTVFLFNRSHIIQSTWHSGINHDVDTAPLITRSTS